MTVKPVDGLAESVHQIMGDLQQKEPSENLDFLHEVLRQNLNSGRLQKALTKYELGIEEYVAQVMGNIHTYRPYLYELQVEKSGEAWLALQNKLQIWSYKLFFSWGAFLEHERADQAYEASIDGLMQILETDYPYDVGFEFWAYTLQRNVCRRHVRDSTKQASRIDGSFLEIDSLDWREECLPDPRSVSIESGISQGEDNRDLLTSISELGGDQQSFIQHFYFDGLSYADISCLMDRKKIALYNLHFSSLKSLRLLMCIDR